MRPLRQFLFLVLVFFGLLVAQWQGFAHGIAHGLSHDHELQIHNTHVEVIHECEEQSSVFAWNFGESTKDHHCSAYDSQTLSLAMPALPLAPPQIDLTHALIKSYSDYQVSIEAYRPFDVRGPPRS